MSRRHAAEKREVLPDAKFGDLVLTKFMNNLMIDGKKSVAEKIVYNALDRVEDKIKRAPLEVFHEALDNISPASKFVRAGWVVPLIRFRSKCAPSAVRPWRSAG